MTLPIDPNDQEQPQSQQSSEQSANAENTGTPSHTEEAGYEAIQNGPESQQLNQAEELGAATEAPGEDLPAGQGAEPEPGQEGTSATALSREAAIMASIGNESNYTLNTDDPSGNRGNEKGNGDQAAEQAPATSPEKVEEQVPAQPAAPAAPAEEPKGTLIYTTNEGAPAEAPEAEEELVEEEPLPDLESLNKEEIFALLREKTRETAAFKYDAQVKKIKAAYDAMADAERSDAKAKYLAEGGDEEAYEFKPDIISREFEQRYNNYRERLRAHNQQMDREREANLKGKRDLIERLRALVEGPQATTDIQALRTLQDEWKAIGQVPRTESNELYRTWHFLVDKFYDNRSIYFELRDLDRKKNLETKLGLVEKAEALVNEGSINKATRELDELHKEWQSVGSVPKDDQETIWQRFKAASDSIYNKRRAYLDEFKQKLDANLEQKRLLGEKAQLYSQFSSDRIDDWNTRSKDVMQLQEDWKAVGPLPKEKSAEMNRQFWSSVKTFFANKSRFFHKIEDERQRNLEAKQALVREAEQLKESDDYKATAQRLVEMQAEWKNIGPVPHKFRDSIYEQFKGHVDAFFNRRRNQQSSRDTELKGNLDAKRAIIEKLTTAAQAGQGGSADELFDLASQFDKIGFVPIKEKQPIIEKFIKAAEEYISKAVGGSDEERERLLLRFRGRRGGSQHASREEQNNANQSEFQLRRKITQLENQINSYETNLLFFSNSRNADALKKDVQGKIDRLQQDLVKLQDQLKILRTAQ